MYDLDENQFSELEEFQIIPILQGKIQCTPLGASLI